MLVEDAQRPIFVLRKGEVYWVGCYGLDTFEARFMNPGWGVRSAETAWIYFEDFFELLDWMDEREKRVRGTFEIEC